MENTNYLFSLKVDQTEFTVGGDKEFVESYMEKWLVLFKDKIPDELAGKKEEAKPEPPPSRGKMSLPEFIRLKSPKSYNDLALSVFFYYERYEGLENVGVSYKQVVDIINKLPNPPGEGEIENVLTQLMEQNFIQLMLGTENNPRYQVTFPGEQCVKQGFVD